jgi:hypothetical protein
VNTNCDFELDSSEVGVALRYKIYILFWMCVRNGLLPSGKIINYKHPKAMCVGKYVDLIKIMEMSNSEYYITRNFVIYTSHLVLPG